MNTKKVSSLLVVLAVATLVVALTRPVSGTFPGKNGRIAFIIPGLTFGNVYTMNPDGSDVRQLTSFGTSPAVTVARWSPDGSRLVFGLTLGINAQTQLWIMNGDGSNQHLLLNDPSFLDDGASFSPDGSQIVFNRCPIVNNALTGCNIYRVEADGTGLTAINAFQTDVFDGAPVYSPDGGTIAFEGFNKDGFLEVIWLMNADGSNIRPLTPPELEAGAPDWSPDGQKIAFFTNSLGGVLDEELWTINANGTGLTRLTNNNSHWNGYLTGPHDISPSWAPQGNAITFERASPAITSTAIYVINADGSGFVRC